MEVIESQKDQYPLTIVSMKSLKDAMFYRRLNNDHVQCVLCPRRCIIPEGGGASAGIGKSPRPGQKKVDIITLPRKKRLSLR